MKKLNIVSALFGCLALILTAVTAFAAVTTDYEYDDQYRLTKVLRSDGTVITYQYDASGNRFSKTTIVDTTPPASPVVGGVALTNTPKPTWSWSSEGGGNGTYRYKLDSSDLTIGATETTATSYTPQTNLSDGPHTLYVQERDAAGNWSTSSSFAITVDTTVPTVAIGSPSATVTKSGPVTYTVTYTGANTVTLTDANVTLIKTGTANGTVAVSGTGNTTRTVTISNITGNGTLGISIAAGTAGDSAGNQAGAGGISGIFTVNNYGNQIVLYTTVPEIPKSTCYQAGTETMKMDSGTTIREGDVIQFTLSNKVWVCKSLNMWLRIATNAGVLETSAGAPVSTTAGSVNAAPVGKEWGFLVQAAAGSQIIRLTLRLRDIAANTLDAPGANIMTFTGVDVTDRLIVKLFDGKIATGSSGFFKPLAATPTVYDTAIVASDNSLCIDTLTQDYLGEYVQNIPDSLPVNVDTKLTFVGDYAIARVMAVQAYNLYTCEGAVAGHIQMGTAAQSSCVAFDFEGVGGVGTGYSTDHTPSKFILQSSQPFEPTAYTMTMEILVNGVQGEHGVYFSNAAPSVGHFATSALACAGIAPLELGVASYLRGDGTSALPLAPITGDCNDIATTAKAVKLTTVASNLGLVLGDSFLFVDFPQFNYNLAEVQSGDVVSVRVSLSRSTCGTVGPFTIPIGVISQALPVASALYANFTEYGLYKWDGSAWSKINTGAPRSMAASGSLLYADYGGALWQWDGSTWSKINTAAPTSMVASGSLLYADYGAAGLWQWNGTAWSQINTGVPASMAGSGSLLYADYGAAGLWQWNGTAWSQINTGVPASMAASGTMLYANFTGYGLYQWNGSAWSRINTGIPARMVGSGSLLYADYGGALWQWNGTAWSQINTGVPASMVASGTMLYANFTGAGLWQWNGSAWSQINTGVPASMVAGF